MRTKSQILDDLIRIRDARRAMGRTLRALGITPKGAYLALCQQVYDLEKEFDESRY